MSSAEFAAHLGARPDMRARFSDLRDVLLDIVDGGTAHYVPNPGNLGDGLIRLATLRFLDDAGVDYVEHSDGFSPEWARHCGADVMIYGGGGAWCGFWSHSIDVIHAAAPLFRRVIVLPSTFALGLEDRRVVFFARDRCESLRCQPGARFCDDMAFYLQPRPVPAGSGTANCFRGDLEGAVGFRPRRGNRDISTRGSHLDDATRMFSELAPYARVRTDRLHVAIAGALLGKRVHLHDGAYFKNRAVYESSLQSHFHGVRFYPNRRSR